MARHSLPLTDDFSRCPPWVWLFALSMAFPWLRLEVSLGVFYPGHLAGGLVAGGLLLTGRRGGHRWGGFLPLVLLGAYLAVLLAWRGQWPAMVIVLVSTLIHALWGAAAFELGKREESPLAALEGLLLLLGASVLVGLSGWILSWLWPAGCLIFPCFPSLPGAEPFLGGWLTQGQYVLWLLLALPVLGPALLRAFRDPRATGARLALSLLAAAAGLGFIAGAPLWGLSIGVLGGALLLARLPPFTRDGDRLLLKALGFGFLFALVLVYGLAPGYLARLTAPLGIDGPLRIEVAEPLPTVLASNGETPITLNVINVSWGELGVVNGDNPEGGALAIGARLRLTTGHGAARSLDLPPLTLARPLQPGSSLSVILPLRLPPWVREGYLSWWARDGLGQAVGLSRESQKGFRFINGDFKRLELDDENRLSAHSRRARDFLTLTFPTLKQAPDRNSLQMILGDLLDTLFFSPLWGEADPRYPQATPFNPGRPFWLDLFHQAGLIGFALALWAFGRLFLHTLQIAGRIPYVQGPAWQFLPISLFLFALSGMFSSDVGSYHGVWAFVLLSGWVEGRHAALFPRALLKKPAKKSAWPRLSFRLPRIRLPRIYLPSPWRRRAPPRAKPRRIQRR